MVLFKRKGGGRVRPVPPRPALLQLLMYMGLGGLSVDRLPVGSVKALLPVGNRTDLPLLQVFQVIEDIVHLAHGDVAVFVLFEEAAQQRSVLQTEGLMQGGHPAVLSLVPLVVLPPGPANPRELKRGSEEMLRGLTS